MTQSQAIREGVEKRLTENPDFEEEYLATIDVVVKHTADGPEVLVRLKPDQNLPAGLASLLDEFFGDSQGDLALDDWVRDEWTPRQIESALDRLEDTIKGA